MAVGHNNTLKNVYFKILCAYQTAKRNHHLCRKGQKTVTQYQTNVVLSQVLTRTPMNPTPLWRRSQNHNWRERSHRKPPEEQRVTLAVACSWKQYGHAFPRRTTYLPEYWSDTPPFPRRPWLHLRLRGSHSTIRPAHHIFFFLWLLSGSPLPTPFGSRSSSGQTFPAIELVTVVKVFPITTTHWSQRIWGTAQNNKVVVVLRAHTHTHMHSYICKLTLILGFAMLCYYVCSHKFPGSGGSENKLKDAGTWTKPNQNSSGISLTATKMQQPCTIP